VDRLSKLEGDQFDRAYIEEMAREHKEKLSDFEEASKIAQNVELKAFIAKMLPTLRAHAKLVQALESRKSSS
jgi:putative membrane protein